ncbi:keratin, type I cytoskeletal 9-like [Leguminivora glycinivorella]|uniref:keratin, type I cytoskeletal 9-like n=1 Tax=Leguminivora glycinivorella TaxID=1035111 RepID=UPI0020101864|nr:keratin, type I cytoskeletal 9-like [Leguminivora glycinivorella]
MKFICSCLCVAVALGGAAAAPASGFVFPDERRREKKLEPVITPPVLPYIEHLERDPSTLLPNETKGRNVPSDSVKPRFGFGGGFNVAPTGHGGLSASISSSANGLGASHSASQSFSFGFNEGFSASHSASQASSFNGFGGGFGGSQASSQAASFGGSGGSLSGAASSASSFGGHGGSGSQSASQAFGFNGLNSLGGFQPHEATFGEGLLDVRHRGIPDFPFPEFISRNGRGKGVSAASFRKSRPLSTDSDDFLAVLVSNS